MLKVLKDPIIKYLTAADLAVGDKCILDCSARCAVEDSDLYPLGVCVLEKQDSGRFSVVGQNPDITLEIADNKVVIKLQGI